MSAVWNGLFTMSNTLLLLVLEFSVGRGHGNREPKPTQLQFVVGHAIYNVYPHPQAGFPGPKTWALARLAWVHSLANGSLHLWIKALHGSIQAHRAHRAFRALLFTQAIKRFCGSGS
jgi:hypothetical protein